MNISEIKDEKDFRKFCKEQKCPTCSIKNFDEFYDSCFKITTEQLAKNIIIYNRKAKLEKLLA